MMVSRSGARMTETRSDVYGYNDRSELTNAVKNATLNEYAYQYDDIGNRLTSLDLGETREYAANNLNQYSRLHIGGLPSRAQEARSYPVGAGVLNVFVDDMTFDFAVCEDGLIAPFRLPVTALTWPEQGP